MRHRLIKFMFSIASVLLIALMIMWAAQFNWAAHIVSIGKHLFNQQNTQDVIRFKVADERGLLVKTWINGTGAYTFAIDTGAGAIILSRRVARESHVELTNRRIHLSGLSGTSVTAAHEASIKNLSLGSKSNILTTNGLIMVTDNLPEDIDGIIDPTEIYKDKGFTIDMRNQTLSIFDPRKTPLRTDYIPPGGAIVPWIIEADSHRPFVNLNGGHKALIDTGSRLGLGVNIRLARSLEIKLTEDEEDQTKDVGGGYVKVRKAIPATVSIGQMVLRNVPTSLLMNATPDAPIILGREVLEPFKLSFDPLNRLIKITPP